MAAERTFSPPKKRPRSGRASETSIIEQSELVERSEQVERSEYNERSELCERSELYMHTHTLTTEAPAPL